MQFPLRTVAGQVAAYIAALSLVAYWITAGAPKNWAVTIPDAAHTYGIRVRTGVDLFFRPAVGWFIEHGLWVCMALAGASLVVEVAARSLSRAGD